MKKNIYQNYNEKLDIAEPISIEKILQSSEWGDYMDSFKETTPEYQEALKKYKSNLKGFENRQAKALEDFNEEMNTLYPEGLTIDPNSDLYTINSGEPLQENLLKLGLHSGKITPDQYYNFLKNLEKKWESGANPEKGQGTFVGSKVSDADLAKLKEGLTPFEPNYFLRSFYGDPGTDMKDLLSHGYALYDIPSKKEFDELMKEMHAPTAPAPEYVTPELKKSNIKAPDKIERFYLEDPHSGLTKIFTHEGQDKGGYSQQGTSDNLRDRQRSQLEFLTDSDSNYMGVQNAYGLDEWLKRNTPEGQTTKEFVDYLYSDKPLPTEKSKDELIDDINQGIRDAQRIQKEQEEEKHSNINAYLKSIKQYGGNVYQQNPRELSTYGEENIPTNFPIPSYVEKGKSHHYNPNVNLRASVAEGEFASPYKRTFGDVMYDIFNKQGYHRSGTGKVHRTFQNNPEPIVDPTYEGSRMETMINPNYRPIVNPTFSGSKMEMMVNPEYIKNHPEYQTGPYQSRVGAPFTNSFNNGGNMYAQGAQMPVGQMQDIPVTEFGAGGTHQENSLGGIYQGIAPNGAPNFVEEGEYKVTLPNGSMYVITNRDIKLDKETAEEFRIPKKYIGKTMKQMFSNVLNKSNFIEREGDSIDNNSAMRQIMPFIGAHKKLTAQRTAEENAKKEEAFNKDMGEMVEKHPEYMQALLAPREQGGPSPEEAAMMEQQMMAQGAPQGGMPPMMQNGGDIQKEVSLSNNLGTNLLESFLDSFLPPGHKIWSEKTLPRATKVDPTPLKRDLNKITSDPLFIPSFPVYQDNTYVKPYNPSFKYGGNVYALGATMNPADMDPDTLEAYMEKLKFLENSVRKGYKGGKWYPHGSVEGGTPTIAYGHKLKKGENFSKGLTESQAEDLLKKDVLKHQSLAKEKFDKKYGSGSFDKLPQKSQMLLTDYHFNAVYDKFPKFVEGVSKGDSDTMLAEFERKYTDPRTGELVPIKQRNEWTEGVIKSYKNGGSFNNPGFKSLPVGVQERIKSNSMMYGSNMYDFGDVMKTVGAGAYGVGEGLLDTLTLGLTDSLTDKGFDALNQAANKNEEDLERSQMVRGFGNTAGAVGGAIMNPGAIGSAVSEGAEGLASGLTNVQGTGDKFDNVVNTLGQVGSMAGGMVNPTELTGSMAGNKGIQSLMNLGKTPGGQMLGMFGHGGNIYQQEQGAIQTGSPFVGQTFGGASLANSAANPEFTKKWNNYTNPPVTIDIDDAEYTPRNFYANQSYVSAGLETLPAAYNIFMGLRKPDPISLERAQLKAPKLDFTQTQRGIDRGAAAGMKAARTGGVNPSTLAAMQLNTQGVTANAYSQFANQQAMLDADIANKQSMMDADTANKERMLRVQQDMNRSQTLGTGFGQFADWSRSRRADRLGMLYASMAYPKVSITDEDDRPFWDRMFKTRIGGEEQSYEKD